MSIAYTSSPKRRWRIDGDGDTEELLKELKFLIDDMSIIPENFKVATLCYNTKKGLGSYSDESYWPLRFISEDMELWLSSLKTGTKEDSSKCIVKALKMMGFDLGKKGKQIIFMHKVVNTTFKK